MDYLKLLGYNFLFSFTIITVTFVLGWLLYNHVVLRKICLKDSLFEKDNVAAWVEFIGAFIFPTLYLSAKAIEDSADIIWWKDLLICIGYGIAYILIFTVLRLSSNLIVNSLGHNDEHGKVNLNNEIYHQKNISAALFSVSLSVIFVSFVRFLDIMPGYFTTSVFKMLNVLIFTLVAFIAYSLLLRRKTTLSKEIFIDNNPAAGISLTGFIFAVEIMLTNAVALQVEFDLIELAITSLIWVVLFGFLSVIFKWGFTKLIKVDIWKEVYEQNSIGAAIGQCALYIGIANVIIHFIK
ncbi:MAG: hypothetical protein N3I35_01455 [Clostridia bacterium]|nr:hypothetical protein [Clostridia bacterium]